MWKHHYSENAEERKQRKRLNDKINIDKKVEIAVNKKTAETKEEMIKAAVATAKEELATSYSVLIPSVINWTKKKSDKEGADCPLHDFIGSSSFSVAPAPAHATAPTPTPSHSSPSSVSGVLGVLRLWMSSTPSR
jgi:hypothetical protein